VVALNSVHLLRAEESLLVALKILNSLRKSKKEQNDADLAGILSCLKQISETVKVAEIEIIIQPQLINPAV